MEMKGKVRDGATKTEQKAGGKTYFFVLCRFQVQVDAFLAEVEIDGDEHRVWKKNSTFSFEPPCRLLTSLTTHPPKQAKKP